jgi:urease subunit gamma/beta
VHLTPHEQERLLIHVAADVAAKRRDRGLLLNYPEAMALLTAHALEAARDGKTVSDVMDSGRQLLTRADLMTGVPEMIDVVQVEATFPDGTKLVTIHDPIPDAAVKAAEGQVHPGKIEHPKPPRKPNCPGDRDTGSYCCCDKCEDEAAWTDPIEFNENLQDDKTKIRVKNTSDRPIQVGSHYHFAEVNPGLTVVRVGTRTSPSDPFDWKEPSNGSLLKECAEAKGRRLNIAAGKSVRFEPGDECVVELVKFQGEAATDTDQSHGLRKGKVTQ